MESWVFGAILALVGFLVIACSLRQEELSFALAVAGISSVAIGSLIFINKFRKWI